MRLADHIEVSVPIAEHDFHAVTHPRRPLTRACYLERISFLPAATE
jgi:hypothetical protein